MTSIALASFLAGSLITLLIPVGLLIGLAIWYTTAVRRIPSDPSDVAPHASPTESQGGESGTPAPNS
jgi:hypothetical protein